jgi:hypothetical protein
MSFRRFRSASVQQAWPSIIFCSVFTENVSPPGVGGYCHAPATGMPIALVRPSLAIS